MTTSNQAYIPDVVSLNNLAAAVERLQALLDNHISQHLKLNMGTATDSSHDRINALEAENAALRERVAALEARPNWHICAECDGTGHTYHGQCFYCGGSGFRAD